MVLHLGALRVGIVATCNTTSAPARLILLLASSPSSPAGPPRAKGRFFIPSVKTTACLHKIGRPRRALAFRDFLLLAAGKEAFGICGAGVIILWSSFEGEMGGFLTRVGVHVFGVAAARGKVYLSFPCRVPR